MRTTLESTAVVMTAYRRPQYLGGTLDSWNKVRGMDRLAGRRIALEPSDRQFAMIRTAQATAPTWEVMLRPGRLGVLVNPVESVTEMFNQFEDVDFVILAEEDAPVAADVLEYFEWAQQFRDDPDIPVVCAHRPQATVVEKIRSGATLLVPGFSCPLVWGTWRKEWFDWIQPTWDRDYSANGWDWNLSRLIKLRNARSLVPEQNRSDHSGEHEGMHCTAEYYPGTVDSQFTPDIEPQQYFLASGPA